MGLILPKKSGFGRRKWGRGYLSPPAQNLTIKITNMPSNSLEYNRKYYLKNREKRNKEFLESKKKNHYKWRKGRVWLRKVAERDGLFCQQYKTQKRLTIEHKKPEIIGGIISLENLIILCLSCNVKRYHILTKRALKYYFENHPNPYDF